VPAPFSPETSYRAGARAGAEPPAPRRAGERGEPYLRGTTALVTGASGFIGSLLAAELAGRGQAVRALVRAGSDRSGLAQRRIEPVTGDILDRESLRRAVAGCDEVYHLAAYARNWARDPGTFFRLNVEGARNVLEVAGAAGVRRILFTSSIVTLGPTPPGVVGDETLVRSLPPLTEYEASKLEAERQALRLAASGLPVVVVNPTRAYGPGKWTEGNSVSRMIELSRRGRLPVLLDGGRAVGNYAFVEDLVRGFASAMARGRVGERYILGGENASLRRFLDLVDETSGRRHRRVALPPWAARLYGALERRRARWLGGFPVITPDWVETFLRDWAFSCRKAQQELGYAVTPLPEGIRRTLAWLGRAGGTR